MNTYDSENHEIDSRRQNKSSHASRRDHHVSPTSDYLASSLGQTDHRGLTQFPALAPSQPHANFSNGVMWNPGSFPHMPPGSGINGVNPLGTYSVAPSLHHLVRQTQLKANPIDLDGRQLNGADFNARTAVGSQFATSGDLTASTCFRQDLDGDFLNNGFGNSRRSQLSVRPSSPWNPLQQQMADDCSHPIGAGDSGGLNGEPLDKSFNLLKGNTSDTHRKRSRDLGRSNVHNYGTDAPTVNTVPTAAQVGLESRHLTLKINNQSTGQRSSRHGNDVVAVESTGTTAEQAFRENIQFHTPPPAFNVRPLGVNYDTAYETSSISHPSGLVDDLPMPLYNTTFSPAVPTEEYTSFGTGSASDPISPQWEVPTLMLAGSGSSIVPSLSSRQSSRYGVSADGSLECPFCGWKSMAQRAGDRRSNLDRHIKTKRDQSEGKRFMCSEPGCSKDFTRSDYVRRHQRKAHSRRE